MSQITFACPQCGRPVQADDSWAGQTTTCPSCQRPLVVPSGGAAGAALPPPIGGQPQTSPLAIASLALSLGSFVIGPLGFLSGIICGHIARREIRRNPRLAGDGMAKAGLIIGYCFLGLTVLLVLAIAVALTFGLAFVHKQHGFDQPPPIEWTQPAPPPPPPPEPPQPTPMAERVEQPGTAVAGTIDGQAFRCDRAGFNLKTGLLTLGEGGQFVPEQRILIFLFPKQDESLEGKSWTFLPDQTGMRPHIHLNWKEGDRTKSRVFSRGYELDLQLGEVKDGTLPGTLTLRIAELGNTELKGDFMAAAVR